MIDEKKRDATGLMRPGNRMNFHGIFVGRYGKVYMFENVRPYLICDWVEKRMVFPASKTLDEAGLEPGRVYSFYATIDGDGRRLVRLRGVMEELCRGERFVGSRSMRNA